MEEGDNKRICLHSTENERGFHTCLNSVDLEQAITDNYTVLRVYEIYDWGWENTSTDLFKPMIGHLIRGKVQSKPGAENLSAEKKESMINAWAKIGVNLSEGEWRGSPAKYQFYKVMLNSLWGKLAENVLGHTSTKFINSWRELDNILK